MKFRFAVAGGAVVAAALASGPATTRTVAQSKTPTAATPQAIDEEYTKIIKQNLQDPRITTELVDQLPASDTVLLTIKNLTKRTVGRRVSSLAFIVSCEL